MSGKSTGSKKVLINSVIYSASGFLIKCFSFFLLPLYTAFLTTEDYGINSLASSFISTMSFVVAFSLFSAIMRFYVELKSTPERLKRFYGTISLFVFISGIAFGLVFYLFREFVSKYLFSELPFFPVIFVCIISLIFSCQHTIYDNILRSQQKALKCSICSIVYFVISVGLNILFVVYYKLGALGTILASLISYFVYTLYFVIEMSITKSIYFCVDLSLLKEALKYSIPIMPHNLSTQIALFVSKLLIGDKVSLSGLGLYTVASQFGNIADTVQYYVDSAYGPWLYEKLHAKESNYKESIRSVIVLLVSVLGLFFIGISLFAHDYITLFVNKSYVESWKYVPLIVLVYSIKTAYYFYVEILFYYKQASKKLFIATLSSSLLNILMSAIFIPAIGIVGSILADGISMLVRVGIIVYISLQYENIGIRISDFVMNSIVVAAFVVIGLLPSFFLFSNTFNVFNFLYKWIVVFIYLVYVFMRNRTQLIPAYYFIRDRFFKHST